MKEMVISLLECDEKSRTSTSTLVREALKTLVEDKLIEITTREKFSYTYQEMMEVSARLSVKLVDCNDKFRGAFVSMFAYRMGPFTESELNEFSSESKFFEVIIGYARNVSCFLNRINSAKGEGFEGKILLKIHNFRPFTGDEGFEVEPLPKHAKYFNEYAELNVYDF